DGGGAPRGIADARTLPGLNPGSRVTPLRRLVMTLAEALCRVLFTYDCVGEEKIPAQGGVVIAANHPSYMDPVLLSLQVARSSRCRSRPASASASTTPSIPPPTGGCPRRRPSTAC